MDGGHNQPDRLLSEPLTVAGSQQHERTGSFSQGITAGSDTIPAAINGDAVKLETSTAIQHDPYEEQVNIVINSEVGSFLLLKLSTGLLILFLDWRPDAPQSSKTEYCFRKGR